MTNTQKIIRDYKRLKEKSNPPKETKEKDWKTVPHEVYQGDYGPGECAKCGLAVEDPIHKLPAKCRICGKKSIQLIGLCHKHAMEWADQRATESHELEYPPAKEENWEEGGYFDFKSTEDRDKWILWMKSDLIPHIEKMAKVEELVRIKKIVEEMKKERLYHWADWENEKEGVVENAKDAPQIADGMSCEYVYNKALSDLLTQLSSERRRK